VAPRHARLIWAAYRLAPALLIDQSPKRLRQVLRKGGGGR
jgi:hypothetical protein